MTDYFIDDGGDNTTGLSWATAWTSVNAMLTDAETPKGTVGAPLASTDRLIFGADTVDGHTWAANLRIYGPSTGAPCEVISSTVGSGTTVSYAKSSSNQLDTSDGAFFIQWDGAFAFSGIRNKSGSAITLDSVGNEGTSTFECTWAPAANGALIFGSYPRVISVNDTVDLTADGTTNRSASVVAIVGSWATIIGMTFVNAAYRTGVVFQTDQLGYLEASGVDASGFTNSSCKFVGGSHGVAVINNCKPPPNSLRFAFSNVAGRNHITFTNVGASDAPESMLHATQAGMATSTASVYRTGGEQPESVPTAWLITTDGYCHQRRPYQTPWRYGRIASTGSKNFDVYITNDTADFDNSQVWLEVELMETADSPLTTLRSDWCGPAATGTTSPGGVSRDDTTSSWTGGASGFDTYKQRLRVTATVGEEGLFRARVCVGVASIASTRDFYIDPKVIVS